MGAGRAEKPANGWAGRVLVIGDDSRSALAVVRSLGRRGLEVVLAAQDRSSLVPASRWVAETRWLPPAHASHEEQSAALEAILTERPFELVMPTTDAAMGLLMLRRPTLEKLARLAVPDQSGFEHTSRKHLTFALAERLGVPAPWTRLVETHADLGVALWDPALPVPAVIKPSQSVVWREGRPRHLKVQLAASRAEVRERAQGLLPLVPLLVQSFFPGTGVGQEFLVDHGEIVAAFQHERIHEPPAGGGSSYRRSVPLDPEMLAHSRRLLGEIGFHGVAMVEYKRDPASGRFVLMEINGRFWGSLPLALAAGMDFPAWLYDLLVHGQRPPARAYPTGLYARNLEKDLSWFVQNWRASRSDPLLITVPRTQPVGELRHLLAGRERWDTVTADDWLPGAREALRLGRWAWGRGRAKTTRKLMGVLVRSALWRRWQAQQLREALAARPTLVFLCKGNVCRSPFAELYARRALGADAEELAIVSVGTWPEAGRCCPEAAVAVAREWGLELDGHRSRRLSPELAARAGAIICMDLENYEAAQAELTGTNARLFLLRAFDAAPPGPSIDDPWGESLQSFRDCYQAIAGAVDGLIGALRPREAPAAAAMVEVARTMSGKPVG
jgi:predicted ATP-grasp superfamily ATP-dependent carboligase/protein-tyrosine-phosphatase